MSNSKKIISLLLSLIMVLSVFTIVPISVSAEDVNGDEESDTGTVVADLTLDNSESLYLSSEDIDAEFHFTASEDALIKFKVDTSDLCNFSVALQHKNYFRFGNRVMYCSVNAGEEYSLNCDLIWSNGGKGVTLTATAEVINTTPIELGNTETTKIEKEKAGYFKYVTDKDALIRFSYSETTDPEEYIWYQIDVCDSEMNTLKSVLAVLKAGEGGSFYYPLEAGESYYFKCELYHKGEGGALAVTMQEEPVEDIGFGDTKNVNIEEAGKSKMFRFVPDRDMQAVFSSEGYDYPSAILYDSNMKELTSVDRASSNFKLTYKVEKDETYYLSAGFYWSSWTGEYTVTVSEYIPEEIKLGETKTVNIENTGDTVDYKFVPQEDMIVEFCSHSEDNEPVGYILNENAEKLSEDTESDGGFCTIAYVEADETYYLRSALKYSSGTGRFDVELKKFEPEEMKLGETKRVEIKNRYDDAWYKFTAPYDCYLLTSTEDDDLYRFGSFDFESGRYATNVHDNLFTNLLLEKGDVVYLRAYIYDFDTVEGSFDVTLSEGEEIKLGETKSLADGFLTFRADHDMLVHYTSTGIDDDEYGQYSVVRAGKSDWGESTFVAGRSGTGNINLLFHALEGETYFIQHDYWGMTVDVLLEEFFPEDIKPDDIKDVTDTAYFKYVPDKNMTVSFESVNSDISVLGTILDEDLFVLLTNTFTKIPEIKVEKNGEKDFALSYDLQAGETYYFKSEPDYNTTGSYKVTLKVTEIEQAGVTLSGAITSYIDDSDVTVKLTGADNNFTAEVKGADSYEIADVPAGKYTLTVSKANHVSAEYAITVADTDVTQDVEIFPLGDVTGDGKTNVQDCTAILRYVRKLDTLSDDQLKVGDVTGDDKVNVQDVTRILRHVRKIEALY